MHGCFVRDRFPFIIRGALKKLMASVKSILDLDWIIHVNSLCNPQVATLKYAQCTLDIGTMVNSRLIRRPQFGCLKIGSNQRSDLRSELIEQSVSLDPIFRHSCRPYSNAARTASNASFVFPPSGPPACAISGRPPPPLPPTATAALRTRSTAFTLGKRSADTPTTMLAFPSA